jgi:hypothetical protein
MSITMQYIPARQRDFFIGNTHVMAQPNYGWQWKIRVDKFTVMFYVLCLAFNQQNYGTSPTRNVERFVRGVQD